jgi:ATP-binding protein involved in chromosome partitioning
MMNITKQQVLDALKNVEEPDLKKDLVTLNMIRGSDHSGMPVKIID